MEQVVYGARNKLLNICQARWPKKTTKKQQHIYIYINDCTLDMCSQLSLSNFVPGIMMKNSISQREQKNMLLNYPKHIKV